MRGPILTREQMRAYDAWAMSEGATPGLLLMENAGRGAAEVIAAKGSLGPIVIVCGTGNNGGDGFVVARHLLARGIYVETFLVGSPERVVGDAQVNLAALIGVGGRVSVVDDDLSDVEASLDTATWSVDAVFGTGLSRTVGGTHARVIELLNQADCPSVALDIPSGIDANTGQVLGVAVRATTTVTFAHVKAGLVQGAGVVHAGEVVTAGLGIPDGAIVEAVGSEATFVDADDVAADLGRRPVDTHKYRAGNLLAIAGSPGKLGAALLVARGALRAGAGLVTLASWPAAAAAMAGRVEEAMTWSLEPEPAGASLDAALAKRSAVAIGPGLGTDEDARRICERVVFGWDGPVVVDADAITCFQGRAAELMQATGPRVLTPHAGELGRLLGCGSAVVEAHRFERAREAAEVTGATVVLKGPRTIIASPGRLSVCAEGNPALAVAGSGDVLTGITGALLAALLPPHEAACAAVLLHARSADLWVARSGSDRGMLAREIADGITFAMASLVG